MPCPVGLSSIDALVWWCGGHLWWIYRVVSTPTGHDVDRNADRNEMMMMMWYFYGSILSVLLLSSSSSSSFFTDVSSFFLVVLFLSYLFLLSTFYPLLPYSIVLLSPRIGLPFLPVYPHSGMFFLLLCKAALPATWLGCLLVPTWVSNVSIWQYIFF